MHNAIVWISLLAVTLSSAACGSGLAESANPGDGAGAVSSTHDTAQGLEEGSDGDDPARDGQASGTDDGAPAGHGSEGQGNEGQVDQTGDNSGGSPGSNPDSNPGNNPGDDSDDDLGSNPGNNPGSNPGGSPGDDSVDEEEPTPDPTLQAFYESFEIPMMGSPEAPVMILEFSDYLCPYCGLYATDTSREIEREYVEEGLVAMSFIDFPIPSHGWTAIRSHEASHCATEQSAYWDMHFALFESQDLLSQADPNDPEAALPAIKAIAEGIGLDGDAIVACVESELYRPVVAQLFQTAQERGIGVTPTLVITSVSPDGEPRNEVVTGYLPIDEFRPYIERGLSHAQGTPVPEPEPAER